MYITTQQQHYHYRQELFAILGGQPTHLTHASLLNLIVNYVRQRRLVHYSISSAWLDTTDTGLSQLLGTSDNRYIMWDNGQRIAGWRNVLDRVHSHWRAQD